MATNTRRTKHERKQRRAAQPRERPERASKYLALFDPENACEQRQTQATIEQQIDGSGWLLLFDEKERVWIAGKGAVKPKLKQDGHSLFGISESPTKYTRASRACA